MMTMMLPMTVVLLLPPALLIISSCVSLQSVKDREKTSPFECGFDPTSKARLPFSLRFFLLAVLFLIFDIEIVIILPFPMLISYSNLNMFSLPFLSFLVIVTIGLFHEWNEGSLNWSE